jgi:hypothetical protein
LLDSGTANTSGQPLQDSATRNVPPEALLDSRTKGLALCEEGSGIRLVVTQLAVSLMVRDVPGEDPSENDLDVFEHNAEFREVLGLA